MTASDVTVSLVSTKFGVAISLVMTKSDITVNLVMTKFGIVTGWGMLN